MLGFAIFTLFSLLARAQDVLVEYDSAEATV
jgi:hypothetical protein